MENEWLRNRPVEKKSLLTSSLERTDWTDDHPSLKKGGGFKGEHTYYAARKLNLTSERDNL